MSATINNLMEDCQMISRTNQRFLLGVLAVFLLPAVAQAEAKKWNTNAEGVVLDGYDVVAYFNQDQAVRGSAEHSTAHDGATFYFANEENLAAFREEPSKYSPKFGGYCAFGVAANKVKAPTDPRTFKIYNGELLLFFNDVYEGQKVNTKILWNQNESELYHQAVAVWPSLD